jgi:DNA-binding transcriptional LysR family regulator
MVALLPQSLAARFQQRFGLAELALPVEVPEFEVYISWHDRTHRHAAHIWFRNQVMQSLDLNAQGPDWAYALMPAFNK